MCRGELKREPYYQQQKDSPMSLTKLNGGLSRLQALRLWQNWMAAYPGCTLQMKMLFPGWSIMVYDTHMRRRSDIQIMNKFLTQTSKACHYSMQIKMTCLLCVALCGKNYEQYKHHYKVHVSLCNMKSSEADHKLVQLHTKAATVIINYTDIRVITYTNKISCDKPNQQYKIWTAVSHCSDLCF